MKSLQPLTLAALLAGLTPTASAQDWLTNGLVAYYPFNGNANDASGNGFHGVVEGVSPTADRFGNGAAAYAFPGQDGPYVIELPEGMINVGQAEYTISLWFAMADLAKASQGLVNTSPHTGIGIGFDHNAPGYLIYNLGPGDAFWDSLYRHGPKQDYQINQWYHAVLTKAGTEYRLFVDGQLDDALTLTQAAAYDYPVQLLLGSGGEHFVMNGSLDDVRIYNRALSPAEVYDLYQLEKSTTTPPGDLLAYYPFDGDANDASGNGYAASVQNAVLDVDRFGQAGHAYAFNGMDAYIELPLAVRDQISGAANLTISVWVKPTASSEINTIFGQWIQGATSFGQNVGIMLYRLETNKLGVSMTGGTGRLADADLQVGDWQQVILTFDGNQATPSNRLRLYVDGTEVALAPGTSTDTPATIGALASNSLIGARATNVGTGKSQFFDGLIDDVRIYNRTLSAAEAQSLYQMESGPYIVVGKAVRLEFVSLVNGTTYQVQSATTLSSPTWIDVGAPFTAQGTSATNYVDVADWNMFWRLQSVP